MTKRKSIFLIISAIILVLIIALSSFLTFKILNNNKTYKYLEQISASYPYFTADELKENADLIVIGKFVKKKGYSKVSEKDKEKFAYEVFTNYQIKVSKVIKGEADKYINLRQPGGPIDDKTFVMSSNNVEFKNGQKYLLYLRKVQNSIDDKEVDSYVLELGECSVFEINKENKLLLKGEKEEDAKKITELYESALD